MKENTMYTRNKYRPTCLFPSALVVEASRNGTLWLEGTIHSNGVGHDYDINFLVSK